MRSTHGHRQAATSPRRSFMAGSVLVTTAALVIAGLGLVRCAPDPERIASRGRFITLASTTSTQNSGLYDHLLPIFTTRTGIEVRVLAVGTGQAIRLAERGDVDVLLVHHRPAEERFVAAGHGRERRALMFNDFVLVGPAADPVGVSATATVAAAFRALGATTTGVFVSRGDNSGTHRRELALWAAAGIDVLDNPARWYKEVGAGMGATLNITVGLQAYTLTDRATWLNFANQADLQVLFEGGPHLVNQYGVIAVNPARHPHVKAADGQRFVDWLTSREGQAAIASYEIDGQQLFFPNASSSSEYHGN